MELPGRPGDSLDIEPRGLWVDRIPHSHCTLKATLALDSHESVSGKGTSREFKKPPRSLSSWHEQAVGLYTTMQWGLIFQKGSKTRQNHLCSRRGDERKGYDKPRR